MNFFNNLIPYPTKEIVDFMFKTFIPGLFEAEILEDNIKTKEKENLSSNKREIPIDYNSTSNNITNNSNHINPNIPVINISSLKDSLDKHFYFEINQRIQLNVEVVNEYFLSNANLNVNKVSFNYMKFDFPRNYLTQPFTIIISGIEVEIYFKDKAKEYNQYFMTKPKENFLNGTINKAMSNFRLEINDIKIKVVEIKNNNSNNINNNININFKNNTEEICEMYIERIRYNFDLDNTKASGLEKSKSNIKDNTTENINDSNKDTDNKSNINNVNQSTASIRENTTKNDNGDSDDHHFTYNSQEKLNLLLLQAKEIGHNPVFKELIASTKKKYKLLQKSNPKQNNFLFILGNHINILNIKLNLSGSLNSNDKNLKNFSILEIPCLDIIINIREKQFYSFDCYCEYVEYSFNSFQLLRNKLLFIEMYGIRAPMWLLDKQIDAFLFSFNCCLCKINVSQFWYKDIFLRGISCESSIEDGIVGFVCEVYDSDDGIQVTSDGKNTKKITNSCITNKNINNNDNNHDSLNSNNNNYSIHFQYINFSYIVSINKLKIKLTTLELLYTLYNYYLHDIFYKNNNIDYSISMPDILSKILQSFNYSGFPSNKSEKINDISQFSSQFSYLDYNFSIIIKELIFDFSLVSDIDKERYLKNQHEKDSYPNDSGSSGFISEYDILFFMLKEHSIVYNYISINCFNIHGDGIYNDNCKDDENTNSNGQDIRNSYVYGDNDVINNLFVVNYLRKEIEVIFYHIKHYIDFYNIENIENNESNKEFRLICCINMIYLNNTNNYERFYNSRFMTNDFSNYSIDNNSINKRVRINFADKEEDLMVGNNANIKNNDNKAPFRIKGNFYFDFDNTSVLINNKNVVDKIDKTDNTQLIPILVITDENRNRINNITKAQILSIINESVFTRINENKTSSNNSNNFIFSNNIHKNYLFMNNTNSTSSFKNYSNNLDTTHKEYYKQVIKKKGTNAIKLNIEYFRNHINEEVREVLKRLVRIKTNDEYNSKDSGYIEDNNNDHLFNSISKIRFENYNGISSMFEEEIKSSHNRNYNIKNSTTNNKDFSYDSFDLIDLYEIMLSTSNDESIFLYLNNDILLQMNCFINVLKSINDKVKESSNEIIKIVSTQNNSNNSNNINNCNSFSNSEHKDSKSCAENNILSINLKTLLLSDIDISRIKILNISSNNHISYNNTDIHDNLSYTLTAYILNNTKNLSSVIELNNLIVNSLVYNNKTFIDLYLNKINYYYLNDFSYIMFKQQQEYFTLFGSYNDNIKMFIYNLDNTRLVNHGNKTVKQLHRLNAFNRNAYFNATAISSNCSGSKYVSIKDNCFLNIEIKLYSSNNSSSNCGNFNNKYKNNQYIFVNSLDMSYAYSKDTLLLEKINNSCFNHSNISNSNNILSKPKVKNDLNIIIYVKDTIVVFDPKIIKTLLVEITRYNEVMSMLEEFKLFISNNIDNKIQLNSISEIKKERDNGGNNDDEYLSSLVRLFIKENKEKLEKHTKSNINTGISNNNNNNSIFEYENNSSNSLNMFLNFKNIIIDYVTAYNYSSNSGDINNSNNSNSLCREEAIPTHKIRTVVYLPYYFISVKKNQKDSKEDILINIENLTVNILKDLTYPIEFNYLHKLEIRSKDILNESSFLTKLGFKEFLNLSYFYIKVKRFYNHYNSNLEMFCNSINVKCTKDLLICGVRVVERLGILKKCFNDEIDVEITRTNGILGKLKRYINKDSKNKNYGNENDNIEKENAKVYGPLFSNSRTYDDIFIVNSHHQNYDGNNTTNNKDLLKTIESITNNSNYNFNNTSSRYSLIPVNQLQNSHFFFVDNYNNRNNNPLYDILSSKYYNINRTYYSKLLKKLILQEKISMDTNDVMLNALIMFHTIKITLYSGKDFCFVNKYIKNNSKFDYRKLDRNNDIESNFEVDLDIKNKKFGKLINKTTMGTCNNSYKIRKLVDQKEDVITEVSEKRNNCYNSNYNSIPNDTDNVDDDIHEDFISHSTVVLPDKKNYLFDTHSDISKTIIDKSCISKNNKEYNKDYKKKKNIMSNIIDDILIVKQETKNDDSQKHSKYTNGNNTYGSSIFDPNINIKSNNNNDKVITNNNNNNRKSSLDSETNFTILILKDYFNQSEEETNQKKQLNMLNPVSTKSDNTNDNQNINKNNNTQLPINTLSLKPNKDKEEKNSLHQTSLFSHQRNQTAILSEAFEALNSEQTLALNESLLKINNNNSLVNIIEAREKYETRNESKFIEININNIISEFSFFNYNYFKIIFEIKTCNVIDSVSNYYNFIIEQQKSKFVKIETVVDRINKEIDFNLRLSNVSINFDYSVINFLNDFFLVKEEMGRSFVFESYFKLIISGNNENSKNNNKRDNSSRYNGNKYDDNNKINDSKNGEDEFDIEVKQNSLNNDIKDIEDEDEEENEYEVLEILDNNNSKNNNNADNNQLSNEIQNIEQSYSKHIKKLNQEDDQITSSKPSRQTQEIQCIKETNISYYKETPIKINNFSIKDFQVTLSFNKPDEYKDITLLPSFNKISILIKGFNLQDIINKELKKASKPKFNNINNKLDKSKTMMLPNYNSKEILNTSDNNIYLNRLIKEIYYHWKEDLLNNQLIQAYLSTFKLIKPFSKIITKGVRLFLKPKVAESYDDSMYLDKFKKTILPIFYALIIGLQSKQDNRKKEYDCNFDIDKNENKDK